MKNRILIIGGTGKLGKEFKKNKFFKNSYYPSKRTLDIRSKIKIKKFLETRKIEIIINCAAIARMSKCEENKPLAFETNVNGTMNLVLEILKKKNLKLIHISSDAVYKSIKGNYREDDKLDFYNFYGLTKILSDYIVRYLEDYLIIRTRFYDKKQIKFKEYAFDSFSSAIEVKELVRIIEKLVIKNVNGVINIGSKKRSDFQIYKKLKKKYIKNKFKIDQKKSQFQYFKRLILKFK